MILLLLLFCVAVGPSRQQNPWVASESYCNCGMKDGWFDNWYPADIWVDLVVVVDTTKSVVLDQAKFMVPHFVGYMSTDSNAEFYSRIGVIAASYSAEVIYNFNMSSSDDLDSIKMSKNGKMNFDKSFSAAQKMISDGQQPARANARQIVYFLTDSGPPSIGVQGTEEFKQYGGIIIVNQFLSEGEAEHPNLQSLASQDYFFTDLNENYRSNLPVLCEANCFCSSSMSSFNDDSKSSRTQANRGCFNPVNDEVPQQDARQRCQKMGVQAYGALVSIHDKQKEFFVSSVVSGFGPKKKYWIGLQNNGSDWKWEDQSTIPFTDWNDGQPNTNGGTDRCAYASQTTGLNVKWTAADCAMEGVIYVCETAPCSIGYKNC